MTKKSLLLIIFIPLYGSDKKANNEDFPLKILHMHKHINYLEEFENSHRRSTALSKSSKAKDWIDELAIEKTALKRECELYAQTHFLQIMPSEIRVSESKTLKEYVSLVFIDPIKTRFDMYKTPRYEGPLNTLKNGKLVYDSTDNFQPEFLEVKEKLENVMKESFHTMEKKEKNWSPYTMANFCRDDEKMLSPSSYDEIASFYEHMGHQIANHPNLPYLGKRLGLLWLKHVLEIQNASARITIKKLTTMIIAQTNCKSDNFWLPMNSIFLGREEREEKLRTNILIPLMDNLLYIAGLAEIKRLFRQKIQ